MAIAHVRGHAGCFSGMQAKEVVFYHMDKNSQGVCGQTLFVHLHGLTGFQTESSEPILAQRMFPVIQLQDRCKQVPMPSGQCHFSSC